MEEKNYDEAEKLCLEKANAENKWHYRSGDPEDWNNMLSAMDFVDAILNNCN